LTWPSQSVRGSGAGAHRLRDRVATLLLASGLACGCSNEIQPELEVRVVTPANQDPFEGGRTVRLQIGTLPPTTTELTPNMGFSLSLDGLRPGSEPVSIALTVQGEPDALTGIAPVVARGRTPSVVLARRDNTIALAVQKVGTLALAFEQPAEGRGDFAALAAPSGPDQVSGGPSVAIPVVVGGLVTASNPFDPNDVPGPASSSGLILYNPLLHTLQEFISEGISFVPRDSASAIVLRNEEILIFGGITRDRGQAPLPVAVAERFFVGRSNLVQLFPSDVVTLLGNTVEGAARYGAPLVALAIRDASGVVIQERVYAVGGSNGSGDLDSVVWVQQAPDQLTVLPETTAGPRFGHTATVVVQTNAQTGRSQEEVLVFGGRGATSAAAVLTPGESGAVLQTSELELPSSAQRWGHAALSVPGGVLIIGGYDNQGMPRGDSLLYEPNSRTFSPGQLSLQTPRAESTVFRAGNDLVVVGGVGPQGGPEASAEVFDVTTLQPVARLANVIPRLRSQAIPSPDDTVLLLGGFSREAQGGTTPVAALEVYRPR